MARPTCPVLLWLALGILLAACDSRINWTVDIPDPKKSGVTKLWVRGCWDQKVGDTVFAVPPNQQKVTLPLWVRDHGGKLRLRVWGITEPHGLVTHELRQDDVELADQTIEGALQSVDQGPYKFVTKLWGRTENDIWAAGTDRNNNNDCLVWHWDGCSWNSVRAPLGCTGDIKALAGDEQGKGVWLATTGAVWSWSAARQEWMPIFPNPAGTITALWSDSDEDGWVFLYNKAPSHIIQHQGTPTTIELTGITDIRSVRRVERDLFAVGSELITTCKDPPLPQGRCPQPPPTTTVAVMWTLEGRTDILGATGTWTRVKTNTPPINDIWSSSFAVEGALPAGCDEAMGSMGSKSSTYSVWGRGPGDVWFGGGTSDIYRVTQGKCRPFVLPTPNSARLSLWAGGAEAFAGGAGLWHFLPGAFE